MFLKTVSHLQLSVIYQKNKSSYFENKSTVFVGTVLKIHGQLALAQ